VSVWSHRARETTAHPDRKLQQTIIQCIVHILVRAEHAGTLVHYPTCVDALAPVWEDDYGSISGPSVYRGYSIYTDQASLRAETCALPRRQCSDQTDVKQTFCRAGGIDHCMPMRHPEVAC